MRTVKLNGQTYQSKVEVLTAISALLEAGREIMISYPKMIPYLVTPSCTTSYPDHESATLHADIKKLIQTQIPFEVIYK